MNDVWTPDTMWADHVEPPIDPALLAAEAAEAAVAPPSPAPAAALAAAEAAAAAESATPLACDLIGISRTMMLADPKAFMQQFPSICNKLLDLQAKEDAKAAAVMPFDMTVEQLRELSITDLKLFVLRAAERTIAADAEANSALPSLGSA